MLHSDSQLGQPQSWLYEKDYISTRMSNSAGYQKHGFNKDTGFMIPNSSLTSPRCSRWAAGLIPSPKQLQHHFLPSWSYSLCSISNIYPFPSRWSNGYISNPSENNYSQLIVSFKYYLLFLYLTWRSTFLTKSLSAFLSTATLTNLFRHSYNWFATDRETPCHYVNTFYFNHLGSVIYNEKNWKKWTTETNKIRSGHRKAAWAIHKFRDFLKWSIF